MTVEKMSLSFEPSLAKKIRREAKKAGVSVSAWVARAAEHEAKLSHGRRLLKEWEAEFGAITDAELAAAEKHWPA